MTNTLVLCAILFAHWVSDHVLQPRWAAINKSSSILALLTHIIQYMVSMLLVLGLIASPVISFTSVAKYVLINGYAHAWTDFFTSRIAKFFYEEAMSDEPRYFESSTWTWLFWVIIGFDQLLHTLVLTITVPVLY